MIQMSTSQKRILLSIVGIGTIIIVVLSIATYTSSTSDNQLPTLVVFPSNTITPSPTMTFTPTATYTSTSTPSPTLTATATHTPTATATNTPSPTATHTDTATPSQTPTLTQTATVSPIPVVQNTAIQTQVPIVQNTPVPPQSVIVINTSVPVVGGYVAPPPQIPTATYTPIPSSTPTLVPSSTNVPPIPTGCIQYSNWNNIPRYVDFNGSNFLWRGNNSFDTPDCTGTPDPLGYLLAYAPGGVDDATAICLANGLLWAEPDPGLVAYMYDCHG